MRAALLAPGVALQFLTLVPLRLPRSIPDGAFPGAVAVFPLVGLLIGVAVAAIDAGASSILPAFVVAALDLVAIVVIAGGLHLDGLADATDGLLGDLPRERRLEVMREPAVGTYGIAAVVLVLLVEYGALLSLGPAIRLASLVAALTLSRWAMSLMLWLFPYARDPGVGSPFRAGLSSAHTAISTAVAMVVALALFGTAGLVLLITAASLALLVGLLALRRVGGCTGDVYGAGGELAFAGSLVAVVALAR